MFRFIHSFFVILFCFLWTSIACAGNLPAVKATAPRLSLAANVQDTPSIQVPESTFDFGEVMEGGEIVHDFVVKNTGKAVLQIEQVRPG
jgi:hypothetical protein